MKTFLLRDGDLVVGSGQYQFAQGHNKVTQDLRCALLEPVGNDRFHPSYGSLMGNYIGGIIDDATEFRVRQEISRVLANYVAVQRDKISRDIQQGNKSRFDASEVIANIDGIDATRVYDSVQIKIRIRTLENTSVTLATTVGL